jgi:ParB-like chromosome segregation protein Spo0J
MSHQFTPSGPTVCRSVAIDAITVGVRQRKVAPAHIARLQASFEQQLGGAVQLQPIVLDARLHLIDGAHRLEAARRAGWSEIDALIFDDLDQNQLSLLEVEANLVRKNLTPVELEAAWSEHYEPIFRSQASDRRRSTLRRGTVRADLDTARASQQTPALSLARAAKQTTGLSIDTRKKISTIRRLSAAPSEPPTVRQAAARAMQRLERPGASVSALYREVVSVRDQTETPQSSAEAARTAQQQVLEHTLHDATNLACRLEGELAEQLAMAARSGREHRELLRALRVSLARALAITVAIECGLEASPVHVMKDTSAEVARLLSRASLDQLRKQGDLV